MLSPQRGSLQRVFVRQPIERLLVAARRWQAGDYTARAALTKSTSEIGKLVLAFDEMAEAVEAREHQRREAEEALASLNANLEKRVKEEIAEREKAQTALIHCRGLRRSANSQAVSRTILTTCWRP